MRWKTYKLQPIVFASLTDSNSTRQHIYVLCLLHKLQYSLMGVMPVEIDTLRLCLYYQQNNTEA